MAHNPVGSRRTLDNERDTRQQMASLQRELEETRTTLAHQTSRCRQLVASFTSKLAATESELQSSRELRDKQLSRVLRALLVLEARLRREQRSIRVQLGERDSIIREQQLEIARLKKLAQQQTTTLLPDDTMCKETTPPINDVERDVKPDLICSLSFNQRNADVSPTPSELSERQGEMDSLQHSTYKLSWQPESLTSANIIQSNFPVQQETEAAHPSYRSNKDNTFSVSREDQISYSDSENNQPVNSDMITTFECKADIYLSTNNGMLGNTEPEPIGCENHTFYPTSNKCIISPTNTEQTRKAQNLPGFDRLPYAVQINANEHISREVKTLPSTLIQEIRMESSCGNNEYQDNPVLKCVNQILLRDQEDFLEEQRSIRLRELEKNKKLYRETRLRSGRSRENLASEVELNLKSPDHNETKNPTLPFKKSLPKHQEKAHILAIQHLTLAGNVDFEEIDKPSEPSRKQEKKLSASLSSLVHPIMLHKVSAPPALPPKPSQFIIQTMTNGHDSKHCPKPENSKHTTHVTIEKLPIEIIDKRASLPSPSPDNDLYVISNSAIDDEIVQRLQGRKCRSSSELQSMLSSDRKRTEPSGRGLHPTHKLQAKTANVNGYHIPNDVIAINISDSTSSSKSGSSNKDEIKGISGKAPVRNSGAIKVASPVSSLITREESITQPTEKESKVPLPIVSKMVRRFEDLSSKKISQESDDDDGNNTLRKNFEEFRLDDCDMEKLCENDGRPDGDGAETRLNGSSAITEAPEGVTYENFLEATGLSQKSIMTPSRMFSNHKSVLKPKDVKHRSRVKAAAVGERCGQTATVTGPTVRYWTEPFL